jgi:hypothetical protein
MITAHHLDVGPEGTTASRYPLSDGDALDKGRDSILSLKLEAVERGRGPSARYRTFHLKTAKISAICRDSSIFQFYLDSIHHSKRWIANIRPM